TGPFTGTGAFSWTGGVFDGASTTTVTNTGTLTVNGSVAVRHGKTLNLNGTTAWNDGDWCVGESSKINNAGTLNAFANFGRQMFPCGGALPVVKNLAGAVFNRVGVSGQNVAMNVPFDNLGTVNVGPGDFFPGPN